MHECMDAWMDVGNCMEISEIKKYLSLHRKIKTKITGEFLL